MESSPDKFFNVPDLKIDLSQAPSIRTQYPGSGPLMAESEGDMQHITKFRRVLEDVIHGLTDATQATIESQTLYFDETIKQFMSTVQAALNDIDSRLNTLSQAQAHTDEVLDAFIKLWMLGNTTANLDDQKEIIATFLKRGICSNVESDDGTSKHA